MSDKETSLAFVERMELLWNQHNEQLPFSDDCFSRFSDLARTAALIEEHKMNVVQMPSQIRVGSSTMIGVRGIADDLHEAVRAAADRIKEQA
jgi:hypothetical protein